jgi:hypothetical protein
MYLAFRTPDGEEIVEEVEKHLEAAILGSESDFWSIGSGDAAVWAANRFNPIQLWIYFDGYDHFQLQFVNPGAMPLIARNPKGKKQGEDIRVSGDVVHLPGETLFRRREALDIALHFCRTQQPDPSVQWKPLGINTTNRTLTVGTPQP